MSVPYVVVAPSYSENNGGSMFLHGLVHTLNDLGMSASLSPMKPIYDPGLRGRIKNAFQPPEFIRAPHLNTPLATRETLRQPFIAVYPEIVRGNPLDAPHVARWLLYPPGALHPFEFGPDEMFFAVGEICIIPEIPGDVPDLFLWQINPVYQNEENPNRKGVCYIVRKGKAKPRVPQTEDPDAIQIDGMSHAEINEVFNKCDTFISYDEATMYSQFAAMTGCTSIVIPGDHASREEWVENHVLASYGVAYGFDDVPHAVATRDKVRPLLEVEEAKGVATVKNFIEITQKRAQS